MTIEEAKNILIQLNKWRRDNNIPNAYEMPDPKDIGIAIDVAITIMESFNPRNPDITLTVSFRSEGNDADN